MAKKRRDEAWHPPYERYVIRFYDGNWEEVEGLVQGPVSMCGACRILLDYVHEREFIRDHADILVSRYRHIPFISVEVYCG